MKIGILSPFNPRSIQDYLDCTDVPELYIAASSVNTLALSLLQAGHQLKIFTLCPGITEVRKLKGANVSVFLIPLLLMPGFPRLRKNFKLSQLYWPQRISKVVAQEVDSLDVLHAHWTYEYAMAAKSFADKLPVFVTVRDWAPYIRSLQKSFRTRFDWMLKYRNFQKVMADERLHFIANSQYTYDCIISEYPGKDVPIIPNPIKKEFIIKEKRDKSVQHQFISISQSLFDVRKNYKSLLIAFREYRMKHPAAQLHLVGGYNKDGADYQNWKDEKLLQGVIFHGNLPHAEVMKLMDSMSCLVHPSLEETFGNILLEAMARCVPCIGGQNSGAVPHVLGQGKYGLLCDIVNPSAIAECMEQLNNPIVYWSLVNAATLRISSVYASDVVAQQHVDLYSKYMK